MPNAPTTTWVHLELNDPTTFAAALQSVAVVFLIARPGDERPEDKAIPFIRAMTQAGVKRVVNLTAMGCERRPDFGLRRVELGLETSGLAWTHLRPNFFMQIFASGPHFVQLSRLRQLRLPAGDAAISFVDVDDIAAVAAQCLLNPSHDGKAYTLTGGAPLTHGDIATHIASVANAPVQYVPLTEEEARLDFARAGLPPENVERLIGFYRLARAGLAAEVTTDVEDLLGRSPRTFASFVADHGAEWNVP